MLEVSTVRAVLDKNSELTTEQRTQLVLRLLSKVEPAAQVARRSGVSKHMLYCRRERIRRGRQAGDEWRRGAKRAGEGG